MRKSYYITIILLLVFVLPGCSQSKTEHLRFLDISMGSNIEIFKKALIEKKLKYLGNDNGMLVFEGMFTNQPVKIGVLITPSNKMPACVFIDFGQQPDRHAAREMYYAYIDQLVGKYGNYAQTQTKYFANLIQEPTDFGANSVIADYATYFTTWKMPTGEIILHIVNNSYLQMIYVDSVNMDIAKKDFNKSTPNDL